MAEKDIDITGIGVSTLDFLWLVDHFPLAEDVQQAYDNVVDGGGPVATALVTASKLGANTVMIDSIGDDYAGSVIIDGFKREGVDTSVIKINKGHSSSCANIIVRKNDGSRAIMFVPGNSPELKISDIPEEIIRRTKYLHVNGRHLEATKYTLERSKKYGTRISFDGGAGRYREELQQIVPLSEICILSKDFTEKYTGENKLNTSAKKLLELGIKVIVITDGINGSWLFTKDIDNFHQPAFTNVDVVDTTGCGDSFHGAFLFALCRRKNLFEAMRIASAVASLNTRHLGGRSGLPAYQELEDFLKIN